MLTLEITPGGRPRVVTIAEALLYLGVDIHRPGFCPAMTPEERRRRRGELRRRAHRRRRQERAREAGP